MQFAVQNSRLEELFPQSTALLDGLGDSTLQRVEAASLEPDRHEKVRQCATILVEQGGSLLKIWEQMVQLYEQYRRVMDQIQRAWMQEIGLYHERVRLQYLGRLVRIVLLGGGRGTVAAHLLKGGFQRRRARSCP